MTDDACNVRVNGVYPAFSDNIHVPLLMNDGNGNDIDVVAKLIELTDLDALWNKMYIHAKKVIVPCGYCGSHNAYTNATCVKCGAPMGTR